MHSSEMSGKNTPTWKYNLDIIIILFTNPTSLYKCCRFCAWPEFLKTCEHDFLSNQWKKKNLIATESRNRSAPFPLKTITNITLSNRLQQNGHLNIYICKQWLSHIQDLWYEYSHKQRASSGRKGNHDFTVLLLKSFRSDTRAPVSDSGSRWRRNQKINQNKVKPICLIPITFACCTQWNRQITLTQWE